MTKKAALYIRVSTVHQIDKDSLPMQRKDLISYAHYVLGIDDYEVFEDAGYSGKNVERPAFKDMLNRCRLGEFSHVLVWKIDRISRNIIDFATMYEELKRLGVSLISKNEQFDTSTAMGEASLKILLIFAELERKTASERVYATMLARAKEGKWNGANVPYGFKWCDEKRYPVVDESEANMVREIFNAYANMKSLTKVVSWLNDEKIPTKRGGKWNTRTVQQMIYNPFYIGILRYNYKNGSQNKIKPQDEWIVKENAHPAIIDKELFEKCQRILSSNSSFRDKEGKHRYVFHLNIFSGLIRCGCCGNSFKAQIGKPRNSGMRFSTYYCSGRQTYGSTCTNRKFYHDELIGGFVFNYISNIFNARNAIKTMHSPKELEHYLLNGKAFSDVVGIAEIDSLYMSLKTNSAYKYGHETDTVTDTNKINQIKNDLSKKERALERLNRLFLYDDEAMPEAEYIVTKNTLRQEILKLNDMLAELSAPARNISDDAFISKASSFILTKVFEANEYINFVELATLVDKPALREFALSIITKITVNNHQVTSIEFANGSIHHFAYK